MRIGLLVPGFSASETDWCIPALLDLVRRLTRRHKVRILSLRYPHLRRSYQVAGAAVTALGGAQTRGLGRVALLARARAQLLREARRESFDLLHALWAHEPGFVATVLAARLEVPTVVSILGGELASLPEIGYGGELHLVNRTLTRLALARATRVTVGSRWLAGQVDSRFAEDRLRVLPLGVDTDRFRPGAAPGHGPLNTGGTNILNVASQVPVKDLGLLLGAFADAYANQPDLRLHLVGEGPCRAELESTASRLGVADRVIFHGHVPHERLADYYRSADLCVLSSRFESQAMVILEAAACGTVTVGTAVGLLPELAPSAWTAPPGDRDGLAGAITTALADRSHLAESGAAWRRRLAGAYDLEAATRGLVDLYQEAVTAARAAGAGPRPR